MTRSAPVAAMARCRPGQSAWSLRTKPRSTDAPPARAAQLHPAAREGVAVVAEAAHPGRALRRRRRDDQGARGSSALSATSVTSGVARQGDAGGAVGAVQRLDRAVHDDRPDRAVDARAGCAAPCRSCSRRAGWRGRPRRCARHQASIVGEQLGLRLPAVDRQAEGRFGDEAVAAHRLERRAGGVVLARVGAVAGDVVVARGDPDLAAVLEPHLRRAEHVAGRMQLRRTPWWSIASPYGSVCRSISSPSRVRSTPSAGAAAR